LARQGVDIISHHNGLADKRVDDEYGLYSMSFSEEGYEFTKKETIAALVWNWGMFYERILKGILSGSWLSFSDLFGAESKPVNFWWGMDSGILDIFYSKRLVPQETQKLVNFLKNMIINDNFNPFRGPVYDREGKLVIEEGNIATREQILSMDWFVEGVEGDLIIDTEKEGFSDLSTGKI
jgi:basic membrane protein A and related proteins